jgi:hypothetical protein
MWKLYIAHVALAAPRRGGVPWSITGYSSDALQYLCNSTTMAWSIFGTYYGTGTYVNKGPAKRADNLPRLC